ncbi:serine hydrolase domain-containing protein [Maribellus maritimus]|uniref:serine hydrolase domain-containing protein n=1 Tax=Maribellus maritimus TaxID=2870838 RepID=UPI001EE9ECD5|nr:serine hydrolase domain-containing protein [Maribellus maritimus]MCG6188999.1 beta-lactamase family protein [Maribellus maritimus]
MKHLLINLLILCSVFSFGNKTYSQNTDSQNVDLSAWIDSQFTEGMNSYNMAGATIVLIQGDSILHMNGYGLADIASNTPVNSNSSIFGIGSVSKTFVATAIMQLYEDGKLELDRDVNSYLTTFQLDSKFNDTITVSHLLTHTAGIDEYYIGSAVLEEKDVIPLAQYLIKHMPTQIRPSGKVISYSGQAYGLLGLIIEDVSGLPCNEYIRQRILKPLEMEYSSFKRQNRLKENYVTGYLQKGGQLIPCKPNYQLNYPEGGLNATVSDMGHFISMFLNNGNFKGIQILDSTTVAKMFYEPFRQYKNAEYGYLMGFQERNWNGITLCGHTGNIPGFESQLSLIPEKNIGLFISANSSSYQYGKSRVFIDQFINDLLAQLIPTSSTEKKVTPTVGKVDEPLEMFTGTYRYTASYGQRTLDKLGVLFGLIPEIEIVTKGDTLEILPYHDKLVPVSDLSFQSKDGKYLAFGRDTKEEISYFFNDAYAYKKLKWYEPVKFQIFWIGITILILLIYIMVSAVRKLFVRNKKSHLIKIVNFSLASLIVLFIALVAFTLITTDPMEFSYGIPLLMKIALMIPFIIIPLELLVLWLLTKAIWFKELGTFDLIYQSVIVVVALFFIPWLMYYNLIGFNY